MKRACIAVAMVVALVAAMLVAVMVPATPTSAIAAGERDRIVFAGNRTGRWDIYTAKTDGSSERRLTTSPLDDISPDVSPNGKLVVFARGASLIPQGPSLDLWIAETDGSGERPLLADPVTDDYAPKWSPDGTRIAFTRHPRPTGGLFVNEDQVFVIDVKSGKLQQFTTEGTFNGFPEWSPDGKLIGFNSTRAGGAALASGIYVMDARDGSHQRRISPPDSFDYNPVWSHDGKWMAFRSTGSANGENDIWKMRPDGTARRRLTPNGEWDGFPHWSPDDRYIAYHSTAGGCPGAPGWTVCSQIWRVNASDRSSPTALTSQPIGSLYVRYFPRSQG